MPKKYNNTGGLWKKTDRTKPSQPHFTGSATVNDEEYWMSMWWHKDPENDMPVFTLSFQLKDDNQPKSQKGKDDFLWERNLNVEKKTWI